MYQLILSTYPDQQSATSIARQLISEKLAACVNIIPGLISVYEWEGALESSQEHLLLIKTQKHYFSEIETIIKNSHPYRIPEIIVINIENGSAEYLKWISSCLRIN